MDEDWIDIGTACIVTDDTPDINEQIADHILDENEGLDVRKALQMATVAGVMAVMWYVGGQKIYRNLSKN